MDRDPWLLMITHIHAAAKRLPRASRRFRFNDVLIVSMYVWAVAHDRPMVFACDRRNYHSLFRPRRLPSISQFHRRVRSDRVRKILQLVHDAMAGVDVPTALSYVDGKALAVGPVSKAPDARRGYAAGGRMAKGYKLHAIVSEDKRLMAWCVRPMNEHEMPIARLMLDSFPPFSERSLLLADGNYDAHVFHKDVDARGGRLVTNLRGSARHPVTRRQMGKARRELVDLNKTHRPLVRMVQRYRNDIELTFSNLTAYGGGLGPLPAFVRRLPRVTRWVGVKITLYHARLRVRKRKAKQV